MRRSDLISAPDRFSSDLSMNSISQAVRAIRSSIAKEQNDFRS
jgi:hypothetical protein